jgi:intein-encoded DNA endonuclease-like protein
MEFHYYKNSNERIKIINIKPLDNYKLRIVFSNGAIKIFDFSSRLKKQIFEPLKNKDFFNTVKLRHGTAFWEYDWKIKNVANDIDIAPERMYWDGIEESQAT